MTPSTNQRVYPGILDYDYEIFQTDQGLKVLHNGTTIDFKNIPMALYQLLKEEMEKEEDVIKLLQAWFPDSEFNRLKKFASCRFGGLDFTPDISNDSVQHGEYWDCPMRGKCEGEGKVCKFIKLNDTYLELIDIRIMKLVATNYTNEVIAEELEVSFGQLHKLKKILYAKLGVQTKQEVTLKAVSLNLI